MRLRLGSNNEFSSKDYGLCCLILASKIILASNRGLSPYWSPVRGGFSYNILRSGGRLTFLLL